MTDAPASQIRRYLKLSEIPPDGVDIAIDAKAAERAAVAERLDLPAIASLQADLSVRWRDRGGLLRVTGTVRARVTYDCVVSLEPFDADVSAEIDESFDPSAREDEGEVDLGDLQRDDAPEPLADNRLDLGELVIQCLSLALDPHPRKPGATPPAELTAGTDEGAERDEQEANPFAVLERLRPRR